MGLTLSRPVLLALLLTLTLATFVLDLAFPRGVAASVLYVIIVLLSLSLPDADVLGLGTLCATLTILGGYLSAPGLPGMALPNRLLTLIAIVTTGAIGLLRNRASARLQESEQRLRVLFDAAPVPLAITRASDGLVLYTNRQFQMLFTLPTEPDSMLADGVFLSKLAEHRVIRARLLEQGRLRQYESEANAGEGRARWVTVSAEAIHVEREPAVLWMMQDITPAKQSQFELERSRRELEQRVRERTGDLYALTQRLQAEITERRQAEQLLAEAQRVAQIGSWEWDIPNDVLLWSPELYRLFGVAPETFTVTYRSYLGCIHPEDRGFVSQVIERALKDGVPFEFYHRVQHGDGTVRSLHCRGEVLANQDGRPSRLHGTAQDVTELMQAEQALRQAHAELERRVEERTLALQEANRALRELIQERIRVEEDLQRLSRQHALILNSAGEGIYGVDRDGRCTFVNPAAASMLGYPVEALLGQRIHDLAHRHSTEEPTSSGRCPLDEAVQTRTIYQVDDELFRRANGTMFPVQYVCSPLQSDHQVLGAVVVFRDVSDRKQSEQALKESESRFRSVAEAASDGIITADHEGRIVFWNRAAQRIFGYEEADVLGQSLTLLMPARFRQAHEAGLQGFRSTGQSRVMGRPIEFEGLKKDGREFPIELSLSTWESRQGRFFTGIIRDITERKEAEAAVRRSERQLVALLEERERIGRDLHDDIIQSLYAIGLVLAACKRLGASNPGEASKKLERSIASLNSVSRKIRHYISRLDELVLEGPELLDALGLLLRAASDAEKTKFVLVADPQIARYLAAKASTHILHIVREAVSNILRHAKATEGRISLSLQATDVVLVLSDDGVGFDPAVAQQKGNGLRNIAARACQLHASCDMTSSLGGGTRITIRIPRKERFPHAGRSAHSSARADSR